MGTRVGRRLVGALAVVAGALAACTGSPSPGANSTWPAVTTAASTTTSVTPSSTTTTLDAQAALQAEAVEAVKKYYDAWNRALVTLDSKELKALSLPTCEACAADLFDLEAFKTNGQTVQGGAITVSNLKALPGVESGIPVQGNAVRAPAKIFSKGVLVKSYSQDTAINRLWVVARSGGHLVMKGIS